MRAEIEEMLTNQVVGTKKAAEIAGVSQALVKKYVEWGRIKAIKIGNISLLDIEDVKAMKTNWSQ